MSNETVNQTIGKGSAGIEHVKIQAAETLEEAARKLRNVDVLSQGEDIRSILDDAEGRIHQTRAAVETGYERCDTEFHGRLESIESYIADHPLQAVLIAAAVGALIGMLISRAKD